MPNAASRSVTFCRWALPACLVGGGVLWALSPLGVRLSELKFKTPDVFWKLFVSAPLLLGLGLAGLLLFGGGRRNLGARIGLWVALAGTALIAAGDVGLYHLGVDDTYIMAASAYRAFRVGLLLLAAGALVYAVADSRAGRLPAWAGLPFALSALAGLLAVAQDLGPFGAALWAVFGAGWVWLGLGLFAYSLREARRSPTRRGSSAPATAPRDRAIDGAGGFHSG